MAALAKAGKHWELEDALSLNYRLPLAKSAVVNGPVLDFENYRQNWDPVARHFLLTRCGEVATLDDVHPLAVAIRLTFSHEDALPVLSSLVPPAKPLNRAAWEFCFTKSSRVNSLVKARQRLVSLKQGAGPQRIIIDKPDFVFVFERPSKKFAELLPILWATDRRVRAEDIMPALQRHCRM